MDKVYGLAQGGANLGPADVAGASPDDRLRYFTIFIGGLLQNFARYLHERSCITLRRIIT